MASNTSATAMMRASIRIASAADRGDIRFHPFVHGAAGLSLQLFLHDSISNARKPGDVLDNGKFLRS